MYHVKIIEYLGVVHELVDSFLPAHLVTKKKITSIYKKRDNVWLN